MRGEGFTRRRGGAEGGRYMGTGNLAGLARTYFGAGEENRAKDAKDAKVRGTPIEGLGSYSFTRRRGGAEEGRRMRAERWLLGALKRATMGATMGEG